MNPGYRHWFPKSFLIGSLLTVSLIFPGCGKKEAPQPEIHRYGFKSGRIEFDASGNHTGKVTVTFDNWGGREVRHTVTQGPEGESWNQMIIISQDWMMEIDLNAKSGIRVPNILAPANLQKAGVTDLESFLVAGEAMMSRIGGKKAGEETIAGKVCQKWLMPPYQQSCIWEGLSLYSRAEVDGEILELRATQVETDIPVDESIFEVPSGVTIEENPEGSGFLEMMTPATEEDIQ